MLTKSILKRLRVPAGQEIQLADYETSGTALPDLDGLDEELLKERAEEALDRNRKELQEAQELLWANDVWSVLLVFQAMDTAGKDSAIKHVMSGLNPQGCQVTVFKRPSEEELDHNFLWRISKALPERGRIGIFNRSHYEEVLVVRVRDDVLSRQRLPDGKRGKKFWRDRYQDINTFERHLVRNGTVIIKFFLHLSKEEQRRRLLARLENPHKHWKFEVGDLAERARWDDYMRAYEAAISATSTRWAPWYVIPADHKWICRALVGEILLRTLRKLALRVPSVPEDELKQFAAAKAELEKEQER